MLEIIAGVSEAGMDCIVEVDESDVGDKVPITNWKSTAQIGGRKLSITI